MSDVDVKARLDELAAFPEALRGRLRGLDEAALRFRPPEGWSAVEVVGHLIEVDVLWAARIRHMLAAERPALAPFDPEESVRQRRYQEKQVGGLLIAFAEQRAEHVTFLRGLRPAQLARTGVHPTRGALSVAESIAIMSEHDQAHSRQIAACLEQYGRAGGG